MLFLLWLGLFIISGYLFCDCSSLVIVLDLTKAPPNDGQDTVAGNMVDTVVADQNGVVHHQGAWAKFNFYFVFW